MAKQMSISTEWGGIIEASYWIPVQVSIQKLLRQAEIIFYGFYDQAAREAGMPTVAQKAFIASGDDYTNYFAPDVLSQNNHDPLKMAYLFVGEQTAFFAEATDV